MAQDLTNIQLRSAESNVSRIFKKLDDHFSRATDGFEQGPRPFDGVNRDMYVASKEVIVGDLKYTVVIEITRP